MNEPLQRDEIPPLTPCCRILQILDSEQRFGVPYGSKSPFSFAFRDFEFRQAGSRSYRFYIALRRCKDIDEYRQHVRELYQDIEIDIEVSGEVRKFPIQMIPLSRQEHENLIEVARQHNIANLPPPSIPIIFLCTLPLPRLLANPPSGKYRREYMRELLTNKIIDFGILVPETSVDLGLKYFGSEISKFLAPVESNITFAAKFCQQLQRLLPKPVNIAMRGTMVDNPVVNEDALRVPAICQNFWETTSENQWPISDLDLDFVCDEDDFEELYRAMQEQALFADVNVDIKGLRVSGANCSHQFFNSHSYHYFDIYLMTDEWVFNSVQRYLHLGLEQPWAYYYASSHPIACENWQEFLDTLYKHITAAN